MSFVEINWLDGISSGQITDAVEVTELMSFVLQVTSTGGGFTGLVPVNLENSLDGENFVSFLSVNAASNSTVMKYSATPQVIRFVRLNVAAFEGGGGSTPTITVSVIGV